MVLGAVAGRALSFEQARSEVHEVLRSAEWSGTWLAVRHSTTHDLPSSLFLFSSPVLQCNWVTAARLASGNGRCWTICRRRRRLRQRAVNRPGAVTSRAAPAPQAEERDCGHELEVSSGASKGKRSGGAARGRGLDRQKDAARGAAQHRKKDLDKEDITSIPGAPTAKERLQVGTQFSRCVDG